MKMLKMKCQKVYDYLAENNDDIYLVYEKKKRENRADFENHRLKYWCWLVKLNIECNVFKKNILNDKYMGEKKGDTNGMLEKNVQKEMGYFELINSIWQTEGACDEILKLLKLLEQSDECWMREKNLLWLIYTAVLLEKGDMTKAEEILHKYIIRHGLRDIERFVTISEFAVSKGISSIEIRRTVGIWKTLKENIARNYFEENIKNKRIAIVGNSHILQGENRGEDIDAHDIVIRINNFPSKEIDYGAKTDVWIREGKNDIKERNLSDIQCLIYDFDIEHTIISKKLVEVLCRNISTYPYKVFFLDYDTKLSLREESKINKPTVELEIIWYLYSLLGDLKNVDMYGLNFMEEKVRNAYYYENSKLSKEYNLIGENEFIKKLIKGERENTIIKKKNSGYAIFTCAYREFDIKKGATGGPGGVCYMQQELLGDKYRNIPMAYLFKEPIVAKEVKNMTQGLNPIVNKISWASDYILNNSKIDKKIRNCKKVLFVCHDIGSAYGAYLLGCPYVIIYHQQGSLANEAEIFSVTLNDNEKNIIQYVESIVFKNAHKVFFPSMGAQEVFKKTTLMSREELEKVNFADYALYNTIREVEKNISINEVLNELDISELSNTDKEIFISVADYNYDKGVDRIPGFLSEYVHKTGKSIVWIAIGNASNQELYDKLLQDSTIWNFEAHLYGNRIEHEKVLELYEWADYYIMLHRKSIFDLATLEAMRAGTAVILSNASSNYEFNVNDNVLVVDCERIEDAIDAMQERNVLEWKKRNILAFHEYFSNEQFKNSYINMIDDFFKNCALEEKERFSEVNRKYLVKWKNKYQGKKVIICGSGSSLDYIAKQDENYVYIALNKALFFDKIKYDFLFMQDYPQNQTYTIEDYNSYDCIKFYGIITNPNMIVKGLGGTEKTYNNVINEIYRYELAPIVYDYKLDEFTENIDECYLADAQSVLFSALQFAVYAGFKEIKLCGVDFSGTNYNNNENYSVYADNVEVNLLSYKKQLKNTHPEIDFDFLHTTNEKLKEEMEKR